MQKNICPRCKEEMKENSNVSRRDNQIVICSRCKKGESYFDFLIEELNRKSKTPDPNLIQRLIKDERSWLIDTNHI